MPLFGFSCFQGYSENENECVVCKRNNKQLLDMIKYQEQSHELHESFHSQLEKADDGFSVVADYFGRGVFNTLTIVPPAISMTAEQKTKPGTLQHKIFYFKFLQVENIFAHIFFKFQT